VPLGVVAVRRELGEDLARRVAGAFERSIAAARAHPREALAFAAEHGRGLDEAVLKTFVDQYVDGVTTDMGEEGVEALRELYRGAVRSRLIDEVPPLDLV
jgi:1,4-dihydroxy-6-naphthoate synthase